MLQAALKHLLHRNDLRKGEGRFGSVAPLANHLKTEMLGKRT
jgi:hypothetical protein